MRVDTTVFRGDLDRGFLTKDVAGAANVTLTLEEAQHRAITFTGTKTGNIIVTFPLGAENHGQWWFDNQSTGAFTLTVAGQIGSGAVVLTGRALYYWTGVDFVKYTASF